MGNSCSSSKSAAVVDSATTGEAKNPENVPMKRKSLEKNSDDPTASNASRRGSHKKGQAPEKPPAPRQPATKLITSNVKEPTTFFIDRSNLLEKLHDTIQKNELAVLSSASKSPKSGTRHHFTFEEANGTTKLIEDDTSGIGKTEMARMYVKKYGDYYNNVIWLQAGNDVTLLRHSFLDLALHHFHLTVEDTDGALEQIVTLMYEKIVDQLTLLIFDDVGDVCEIEKWLPQPSKSRFVLVTSRGPESWTPAQGYQPHQTLLIEPFEEEEGAKFIIQKLHHLDPATSQAAEDQGGAKKLNKVLNGLPLALNLAVAYIKLERIDCGGSGNGGGEKGLADFSIQDYIQLCQDEEMAIFGQNYDDNILKKSAAITFNLTLSKLGGATPQKKSQAPPPPPPQLLQILERLAFLHGAEIPRKLLYPIFLEIDMPVLDNFLENLENFGLIRIHNNKNVDAISIHRLLQGMMLEKLKKAGKFESTLDNLAETMHIFLTKFPLSIQEDEATIVPMVNNCLSICDQIDNLRMTKNETLLKVALSADLQKIGNYAESIRLCKEVYHFVKNSVGDGDPLAIAAKKQIANAYVVKGDLGMAEEYFKQILTTQLESQGEFHEESVKSMENVAQVLETAGKFEEALVIFEKIIDIKKIILGWDGHPDIVTVKKDAARLREKIRMAAKVQQSGVGANVVVVAGNNSGGADGGSGGDNDSSDEE